MPEQIDKLFPQASREQCWGFVGCAGEIANNIFAAGGRQLTLRAGNWDDANPELWTPGLNIEADVVTLEAVTEVSPYSQDGVEPSRDDVFSVPIYQLDVGHGHDKRPVTTAEAVPLETVPALTENPEVYFRFKHWDPFYSLKKVVSDVWAVLLQRGGLELGVSLFKGEQESEAVPATSVNSNGERVTTLQNTPFVPVYLVFQKSPEIELSDIISIRSFESAYDPTWDLAGLLKGDYRGHRSYQSDGSER